MPQILGLGFSVRGIFDTPLPLSLRTGMLPTYLDRPLLARSSPPSPYRHGQTLWTAPWSQPIFCVFYSHVSLILEILADLYSCAAGVWSVFLEHPHPIPPSLSLPIFPSPFSPAWSANAANDTKQKDVRSLITHPMAAATAEGR